MVLNSDIKNTNSGHLKPNNNFKEELFSNWWRKETYEETTIWDLDSVTLWASQASYCNSYEPQNVVPKWIACFISRLRKCNISSDTPLNQA